MKVKLAGIVVAVGLAVAGSALAAGAGVVASANGDYGFSGEAAGSTFVIGPFTWNVQVKADGTTTGELRLHAGPRRSRTQRERLAPVRVFRGRPRVGRRGDRGEFAAEPDRPRHVVPGP